MREFQSMRNMRYALCAHIDFDMRTSLAGTDEATKFLAEYLSQMCSIELIRAFMCEIREVIGIRCKNISQNYLRWQFRVSINNQFRTKL